MQCAIAAVFVGSAMLCCGFSSLAQTQSAASPSHATDVNVYPQLSGSDPFDLVPAPRQKGPAGTVQMSSAAPAAAYSFKDMLANTHGYVSTQVSSHGGYGVEAGAMIPILPGKAELEVGGGTGQLSALRPSRKYGTAPYDSYYADLHLHPTDDIDAEIGFSGMRVHGPSGVAYTPFGAP